MGVFGALLATGCDFQTFRLAFPDVTYSLGDFIDLQVSLDESGRFVDEEARIDSTFITGAAGDLDGDGVLDGAAVLVTNTGGTGYFYTVHAILGDGDGGFSDVGSSFIGDRIAVTSLEISGSTIEVSRLVRADDEPFLAEPTIPDVVRLVVRDGELFSESALEVTPTE